MWKPPAPASSPRSASWRMPARSSFAAMPEEASLSRVMREPAFTTAPRLVAFGAERGLPAAVQALVAAAAAAGHDRRRREGDEEGGRPGVSVLEDATLEAGEARVRGPWAVAELTRDALWSSVGEALGLEERASPRRLPGLVETSRSRKIP